MVHWDHLTGFLNDSNNGICFKEDSHNVTEFSILQGYRQWLGKVPKKNRRPWQTWLPGDPGSFHWGQPESSHEHWYAFHWGGRKEMQFNVGMWQQGSVLPMPYYRIGVAWNSRDTSFMEAADIDHLVASFKTFQSLVAGDLSGFTSLVSSMNLEVEYWNSKSGLKIIPNTQVVSFIQSYHFNPDEWFFVGRILRRGIDKGILEDENKLRNEYRNVFGNFIMVWRDVERISHKLKPICSSFHFPRVIVKP
jgi:hypothetical protein